MDQIERPEFTVMVLPTAIGDSKGINYVQGQVRHGAWWHSRSRDVSSLSTAETTGVEIR